MVTALQQLAEHVWLLPHDPDENRSQPCIGIIDAGRRSVLVDAGNSPEHARQVHSALQSIDAPPVSHIIYTHHHWDHVFGAQVFQAPVIAHHLCHAYLSESAKKDWGPAYLQEAIMEQPEHASGYRAMAQALSNSWQDLRVVLPEITFSQTLRFFVGDVPVELAHVGGEHAADSIIVRLPQAGVLFLGDCFYPPPAHRRPPGAEPDWKMLAALVDDRIDTYVIGHSGAATRAEMQGLPAQGRLS